MFPHSFLRSLLPAGNRNAVALVIHVLIDTTLVRVAIYTDSQVGIRSLHLEFQNYSTSIECPTRRSILEFFSLDLYSVLIIQLRDIVQTGCFSRLHPEKLVSSSRRCPGSVSVTVLKTSVSFPRSVCNSYFLQTILHLVLQLVDLILISELFVSCLVPVNFKLRQLPFSSVTVIRLDLLWTNTFNRFCHTDWPLDFLTPTQFRLRSAALFGITTLPSISFVDFSFTYSCNSPVFSSSVLPCHSALLRAVHLTHLPLPDITLNISSGRPQSPLLHWATLFSLSM